MKKNDFKNYEVDIKAAAAASAIRSEREDIKVERSVIEDCFTFNRFFVKKQKNQNKKKTTEDCKSLNSYVQQRRKIV